MENEDGTNFRGWTKIEKWDKFSGTEIVESFVCLDSVCVLFNEESFTGEECVLTWELRVRILRDCAAALKYLHYHMSGCIVHRDIKVFKLRNLVKF